MLGLRVEMWIVKGVVEEELDICSCLHANGQVQKVQVHFLHLLHIVVSSP